MTTPIVSWTGLSSVPASLSRRSVCDPQRADEVDATVPDDVLTNDRTPMPHNGLASGVTGEHPGHARSPECPQLESP